MLHELEPTLHSSGNMGPDLGAREAALRRLTALGGAALLLTCVGCQQVVHLGPQSPPGDGSAPAAVRAQVADSAELEHALRHLERRLATIEARLAPAQGAAAAEELRDERLLLTVALMLIQQDIAAARRGERGEPLTVEQQLDRASRRILRARERLARGEIETDGTRGWAGRWDLDQPGQPFTLAERDRRDQGPLRRAGRGRGCSPADPLCGGLDGPGDELAGEDEGQDGGGDWTVAKPESLPKPPGSAKPDPSPTPVVPDPDPVPGPAAARVAHAQAPRGVTRAVSRRHGQLAACVTPALRSKGVRLRVRVRLDTQGTFREPRVLATDLDPQVTACIEDVFRQMRVAGYDRGSRHITVPLWLGGDR
ncbi:MAG: hypothetical protein JRI68_01770 [Deltaproteobacteria bacterium]|nr:hypothetical protein [Deltaproteobacteria bacterium]